MEHLERLGNIEIRGKAIGMPLSRLCRRAGVPVNTVWRWRRGGQDLQLRKFLRAMDRLEGELVSLEREALDHLQKLHSQPEAAA